VPLDKEMGFFSKHNLFTIITGPFLVFFGLLQLSFYHFSCKEVFFFVRLLAVLPMSRSLHHTVKESLTIPLATKSLRKSLLILSGQITLFLINSLSVRSDVLRFCPHFPFCFGDRGLIAL
jgi:hypothetical protein